MIYISKENLANILSYEVEQKFRGKCGDRTFLLAVESYLKAQIQSLYAAGYIEYKYTPVVYIFDNELTFQIY